MSDMDKAVIEERNAELKNRLENFITSNYSRQTQEWLVNETNADNDNFDDNKITEMISNNEQFIQSKLELVTAVDIQQRRLTMSEACKLNVRRFKSAIQFNNEFYLGKFGTSEQKDKYTPLVIRRLFKLELYSQVSTASKVVANSFQRKEIKEKQLNSIHDTAVKEIYNQYVSYGVQTVLDSPTLVYQDGDQFTFFEEQMGEVTYLECMCPRGTTPHTIEQMKAGICPSMRREVVQEIVPQLKHNVGHWNCNSCLVNGNNASIQTGETKSEFFKATKWCPNFLASGVGPLLAKQGVEKYKEMLTANSREPVKLCYGGIMHIQATPLVGAVKMNYKCDTCGLTVSETHQAAESQPQQDLCACACHDKGEPWCDACYESNHVVADESAEEVKGAENVEESQ